MKVIPSATNARRKKSQFSKDKQAEAQNTFLDRGAIWPKSCSPTTGFSRESFHFHFLPLWDNFSFPFRVIGKFKALSPWEPEEKSRSSFATSISGLTFWEFCTLRVYKTNWQRASFWACRIRVCHLMTERTYDLSLFTRKSPCFLVLFPGKSQAWCLSFLWLWERPL